MGKTSRYEFGLQIAEEGIHYLRKRKKMERGKRKVSMTAWISSSIWH
jgi:hypothetical protein